MRLSMLGSVTRSAMLGSVMVALGACVPDNAVPAPDRGVARPGAVASPPSGSAAVTPERGDAGANKSEDGVATSKWRSVPREDNGFYAVLDGLCSDLVAERVGKDVIVYYGGKHNPLYAADGHRAGAASFATLRSDGLVALNDPPSIESPTGLAGRSGDDFWIADSTGSRSSKGAVLHRYADGRWRQHAKDQTNIHAWVDGGVIGTLGFAAANGEIWVEGSTTKPPPGLYAHLPYPSLAAFPTGDVLLLGHKGASGSEGPLIARHWAPGKKVTEHALKSVFPHTEGDWKLVEHAPDELYVTIGSRTARWDGASFRKLAPTLKGEKVMLVRRAAVDDLWILTQAGNLQRITQGTASAIATPEPIVDFDGVEVNDVWLVGKSGKLYRRDGEGWKPMPLPAPFFSAGALLKVKRVLVGAPGDVVLTTMYWERGLGWRDQELHTGLYRTTSAKETLRCNEPDPENNNIHLGYGFQSWPPTATAACKTPFAVLARRSKAIKKVDDWPRLRAGLKGKTELGPISLLEFVSGDRTFVGAKAKDLAAGKAIVAAVTKNDRLRPEIVCGEPEPTRTLVIDSTTGAATIQ